MPIRKKNRSNLLCVLKKTNEKATRLDNISKIINWNKIWDILQQLARGADAVGRPAYDPLTLYKGLLLQRLYNLSDESLNLEIIDRASFQKFMNITDLDLVPDATTFCRFREELLQKNLSDAIFNEILRQIQEKGLEIKNGIAVDATILPSARHPRKIMESPAEDRKEPDIETEETDGTESERKDDAARQPEKSDLQEASVSQPEASQAETTVSYSDDREAAWTVKAKKAVYGYKGHIASEPVSGLVLCGHITPANRSDMNELDSTLSEIPTERPVGKCYADKGYASRRNREIVQKHGLSDGIMDKAARKSPLTDEQKKRNSAISKMRCGIERIFGTLKRSYGLFRLRYIGIKKVSQEFKLALTAYNLMKFSRLTASQMPAAQEYCA